MVEMAYFLCAYVRFVDRFGCAVNVSTDEIFRTSSIIKNVDCHAALVV